MLQSTRAWHDQLALHALLCCSLERKKSPNRLVVDDAVNQVRGGNSRRAPTGWCCACVHHGLRLQHGLPLSMQLRFTAHDSSQQRCTCVYAALHRLLARPTAAL